MRIFKLPDLGEGLQEAEIAKWYVKEGDQVKEDQVIVAVETAKALVDIPSPQDGTIVKLFGEAGDIIQTADPLVEFVSDDTSATSEQSKALPPTDQGSVVGEMPVSNTVVSERAQSVGGTGKSSSGHKATPSVRALARRMDVDLSVITPTGPNNTITSSDVERVAKILTDVGKLEILKGVRRTMAITMTHAHTEVVPVTINDDADIESWHQLQDTTIRLIHAMVSACKQEPALNAWYDSHSIGRRLIKQVHLGIAVDTKDGLFVPVIKEVETISFSDLREKIDQLKVALENRSVPPEQLRGHTITLSNFGGIGGRYANPVVVPPTVAILGAGSIRPEAVAIDGELKVHRRIPLSLTFDHRAVTGGEACRFLAAVIKDLELPE